MSRVAQVAHARIRVAAERRITARQTRSSLVRPGSSRTGRAVARSLQDQSGASADGATTAPPSVLVERKSRPAYLTGKGTDPQQSSPRPPRLRRYTRAKVRPALFDRQGRSSRHQPRRCAGCQLRRLDLRGVGQPVQQAGRIVLQHAEPSRRRRSARTCSAPASSRRPRRAHRVPPGRQNEQCDGTAVSRKRFCLSPTSSGIMKPCTFVSFLSSARISLLNSGTILLPCFTGDTCASVRHDTMPARSGRICAENSFADGKPAVAGHS